MDPRLLSLYNAELQHLREMAAEFGEEFPKIAGRLGLDGTECTDPHVERLIEAFAFLTARVHLKLDAEFPRFTQHLLEMVYPGYLSPTPSMAIMEFQPDLGEGTLAEGVDVPRGASLTTTIGAKRQTSCEFRTAHPVTLWPLSLAEARYRASLGELSRLEGTDLRRARSALVLRVEASPGQPISSVLADALPIHLRGLSGADTVTMRLYELLVGHSVGVVVREPGGAPLHAGDGSALRALGFGNDHSLLPSSRRSFEGYRLLHEYFAFPSRFMFVELSGLRPGFARAGGQSVEVVVLLDDAEPALESAVDASRFALYCTPAINLFPKTADRIHLDTRSPDHLVVPDRTRPIEYEVYDVQEVVGYGTQGRGEQRFAPFYSVRDASVDGDAERYYTLRREPRVLPAKRLRALGGTSPSAGEHRGQYIGHEVFVALVDGNAAPVSTELRQLGVKTRCTNRHLPLLMRVGGGRTDFSLQTGAPVSAVRCLEGPTRPRPSKADGETAWKLLSHLSLNWESLSGASGDAGATPLRALLALYGDMGEPSIRKQVDGVRSIEAKPVIRRAPTAGPIAFVRGLEITAFLDEIAFEGTGVFLLGAVLDRFFAGYVTLNSFSETVVRTEEREVMRWPLRTGRRAIG